MYARRQSLPFRFFLLTLCLMLFSFGASAMETLTAPYRNGLYIRIIPELKKHSGLKGDNLTAVRRAVAGLTAEVWADDAYQRVSLTEDQPLLTLIKGQGSLYLSPINATLTGTEEALRQLPFFQDSLPDWNTLAALPETVFQAMEASFEALAPYHTAKKTGREFAPLGKATHHTAVTVTQDALLTQREAFLAPLLRLIDTLPARLPRQSMAELLSNFYLEKPLHMQRFMQKDGAVLGYVVKATVSKNGADKRDISLVLAKRGQDFTCTFKAPALKGADNLTLHLTHTQKENSRLLDGQFASTVNKQSERFAVSVSLGAGNGVTPQLTVSRQTKEGGKWSVALDGRLKQDGDTLTGPLSLKWTQGKTAVDLLLNTTLKPLGTMDILTGRTLPVEDIADMSALMRDIHRGLIKASLPLIRALPSELIDSAVHQYLKNQPIELKDSFTPTYLVKEDAP